MKNYTDLFISLLAVVSFLNTGNASPINQYINNVTPAQNAVSINKSSNITIIFTQGMNPETITNAIIIVFGYQTGLLPVTIDYNFASKTANINPNQDLKAGEKISVTYKSTIYPI